MFGSARYITNHRLAASKIYDDEAIVINTATGRYYDLEGSGADIWALLADGISVSEAAAILAGRYDVEHDEAAADISSFIERLVAEKLVLEAEDPAGDPAPIPAPDERGRYMAPSVTTFTDMEELLAADPPMPVQYTPVWEAPPAPNE